MKKLLSLLLVCILTLSLAACGGRASNSSEAPAAESRSDTTAAENSSDATNSEAEASSGAAVKISTNEYEYKFDDTAVLYESDQVALSLKRMTGKNGRLNFFARIDNKTSDTLRSKVYAQSASGLELGGSKSDPVSGGMFRMLEVSEWNSMIGETDECFVGTFQIVFSVNDEVIGRVQFDLYTSEKKPFVNVKTGDDLVPFENIDEEAVSAEENEASPEENADSETGTRVIACFGSGNTMTMEIYYNMQQTLAAEGISFEMTDTLPEIGEDMVAAGMCDLCLGSGGMEHNPALSPIAYTTVVPFHLYSAKYSSPEEIPDDESIGLYLFHVETSARVQSVLEAAGLIKTKNGPADNLNPEEIEYRVADIRTGTDLQAILGNAENFGALVIPGVIDSMEPIFRDPGIDDKSNWETLLVRTSDLDDPEKVDIYKKIVDAYQSETTMEILKQQQIVPLPVGWDEDLI